MDNDLSLHRLQANALLRLAHRNGSRAFETPTKSYVLRRISPAGDDNPQFTLNEETDSGPKVGDLMRRTPMKEHLIKLLAEAEGSK